MMSQNLVSQRTSAITSGRVSPTPSLKNNSALSKYSDGKNSPMANNLENDKEDEELLDSMKDELLIKKNTNVSEINKKI